MSTTRERKGKNFYKASELYLRIPIREAAIILTTNRKYYTCADYDGEQVDVTRTGPDQYHIDPAWEYYAV